MNINQNEREELIVALALVRNEIGRVLSPEKLRASNDNKRRLAETLARLGVK